MSIACNENFIIRRKSYIGTVSILMLQTLQNAIENEGLFQHLHPNELLLTSCKFSLQFLGRIVIAGLLPKLFIVLKFVNEPLYKALCLSVFLGQR